MQHPLFNTLPKFPKLVLGISIETGLRYLLLVSIAWFLGYVWFKRRWFHRKIIQRWPSNKEVLREMGYSLLTLLIFGIVGAATITAGWHGKTKLYRHIDHHGWAWFWLSVGFAILFHDAYFYWTHRLMHHPRLFRWFHKVHHQSMNPSPWAAYSFSPLEALVQAAIFPLVISIIPMHVLAFALFMFWQLTFNVLGHAGYEFHPPWLMDSWLKRILNTPTNHILHHEKLRGNYGLYFNIWDRLMGTNHEQYEKRFREVTTLPKSSVPFVGRSLESNKIDV